MSHIMLIRISTDYVIDITENSTCVTVYKNSAAMIKKIQKSFSEQENMRLFLPVFALLVAVHCEELFNGYVQTNRYLSKCSSVVVYKFLFFSFLIETKFSESVRKPRIT